METTPRVYLSPPDVGDEEKEAVLAALESGWVAPLGPEVDAFEGDLAESCGVPHAVALSSGTAGLHLALLGIGVQPGDDVAMPSLTFAATAFAATYVGARPVFIDCERVSWNLDPDLLSEYLTRASYSGRLPAAVISVDLFGRTADYDRLIPICAEHEVPLLVDAAESLGATHHQAAAGSMGVAGVYSFNGNKIITTSGGGALVTHDSGLADRARYLSTQARQPVAWYEHMDVGFNYRMSNILAALGRAQLRRLPSIKRRRREIRDRYAERFQGSSGIAVMGDPPWGTSNAWLTTILLPRDGQSPSGVIKALNEAGIEARRVWKPMHLQPVFSGTAAVGGDTCADLFNRGVCLPSGARMTDAVVDDIAERVLRFRGSRDAMDPRG